VSSIYDELDREYAPAWRPTPGDKLAGTVTDITARDGEYGRYAIVTLNTGDGEVALHCFHEVLANEFARIAPKVGDEVGVKYVGKDPDKGYHRYRVRRAGDGDSFDWGRYGAPDDPGPEHSDDDEVPF
jgi:hypothetical protein